MAKPKKDVDKPLSLSHGSASQRQLRHYHQPVQSALIEGPSAHTRLLRSESQMLELRGADETMPGVLAQLRKASRDHFDRLSTRSLRLAVLISLVRCGGPVIQLCFGPIRYIPVPSNEKYASSIDCGLSLNGQKSVRSSGSCRMMSFGIMLDSVLLLKSR